MPGLVLAVVVADEVCGVPVVHEMFHVLYELTPARQQEQAEEKCTDLAITAHVDCYRGRVM